MASHQSRAVATDHIQVARVPITQNHLSASVSHKKLKPDCREICLEALSYIHLKNALCHGHRPSIAWWHHQSKRRLRLGSSEGGTLLARCFKPPNLPHKCQISLGGQPARVYLKLFKSRALSVPLTVYKFAKLAGHPTHYAFHPCSPTRLKKQTKRH